MTYALKKVLLEIIVFLTAPIVFAFVPRSWNRLPGLLRYWEDFNYGINGDPYWINPNLSDHPKDDDEARSWQWRTLWCWRNANTFDHENGLDTRKVIRLSFTGDPETSNRPGHSGNVRVVCWDIDENKYVCEYTVKQWWNTGRCYRSYTGYKLLDLLEWWIKHDALKLSQEERIALMDKTDLRRIAQRVYSINPLMGYERK